MTIRMVLAESGFWIHQLPMAASSSIRTLQLEQKLPGLRACVRGPSQKK